LNSDSPGSDAMKTRAEPGNPEARHLKLTTDNCLGETPLLSVVNSISDRFSVDSGSLPFIFTCFRLPTIYFSTVSPSPLTAETRPLSPGASKPCGSRKLGVTNQAYKQQQLINSTLSLKHQ
jgi:hypothetical protein